MSEQKARGVRISDPDALDKIASVEGAAWREDHSTRESPYTFKGVLASWTKRIAETKGRRGVSATVYGAGGWNRWHVLPENGEIVFSRSHGHPGDDKRAEAAGFRVV